MSPSKKVKVLKTHRPAPPLKHRQKEPEYTVQISEPSLLRRDLLESLREIIIFMQGYEKFRRLQEEKVATFTSLKTAARELNSRVERLKKFLPKGKLKAVQLKAPPEKALEEEEEAPKKEAAPPLTLREKATTSELNELEGQLREIEEQLKGVK